MSNNNLHKIFADTACVSTEMMIDYLDGKLSEKEKNTVEVHIASCEMCSDEFEGLSLLENKSKLAAIITTLDSKIDDRTNTGRKKIPLFKPAYKIAAAIIILIASGWFLKLYVDSSVNSMDESTVSQVMEEKTDLKDENTTKPIVEEPTIEISEEEIVKEQRLRQDKKLNRSEEIKGSESKKGKITNQALVMEDAESDLEFMEEEIAVDELSASTTKKIVVAEYKTITDKRDSDQKKTVSKEIAKTEFDDDTKDKEENEEVVTDFYVAQGEKTERKATRGNNKKIKLFKGRSKKKTRVMSNTANSVALDNFDLGMTEYNKRDYKEAVELFKNSLNAHSNPDEVHFYLAKSYTQLEDTENALENYNKVIAFSESPYYQDALWNKAQILVNINKRKSAVNSLNQLKNKNGVYSKRANEMIDSINIAIPTTSEEDK